MPSDHRSPTDIERDIERERSDLAGTIEEIQSRFTPEAVINEIARNVRDHGGDVGQAVTRSVKQNPIGLALTGVGLAWMIFGRSYNEQPKVHRHSGSGNGRAVQTFPDDEDEYQPHTNADPFLPPTGGASRGPVHEPDWLRMEQDVEDTPDSGPGNTAGSVGASVKTGAEDAAQGVSDAAHSAAEGAARARDRLAQGTEDLSEAARERIVTARRRAVAARRRASQQAQRRWHQGKDKAVDFFEEQPLVAGALALAAGAALAATLPRTRQEDEWAGEYSDELMDEAERIYLEERDKAKKVAVAALDETRDVIEEKSAKADQAGAKAVDKVREEASDAGERIASATREEADKQKPGKPES